MAEWRLKFMDGTSEKVDIFGPRSAWIIGKMRAAKKKTYLLGIEKVNPQPRRFLRND